MPRRSPWPNVRRDEIGLAASSPVNADEDNTGWLVTFSDIVLQLFAFVLVASVLGRNGAPIATGNVAPLQAPPEVTAAMQPDALSAARLDELPPAAPALPRRDATPVVTAETAALTTALQPIPVAEPASAPATSLAAELASFVASAGLDRAVQVAVNGGGVTLTMSDTIGFASGSAELLGEAAPLLAEVRSLMAVRPELAVEVAGHTDDVPIHSAQFASNLELSLARAARVARELTAGDDALGGRVYATGYGPERPVAANDGPEGRARNRRVEIRLVPGGDGSAPPARS